MANLTLRTLTNPGDTTKGSNLSAAEVDQNFININNELKTKGTGDSSSTADPWMNGAIGREPEIYFRLKAGSEIIGDAEASMDLIDNLNKGAFTDNRVLSTEFVLSRLLVAGPALQDFEALSEAYANLERQYGLSDKLVFIPLEKGTYIGSRFDDSFVIPEHIAPLEPDGVDGFAQTVDIANLNYIQIPLGVPSTWAEFAAMFGTVEPEVAPSAPDKIFFRNIDHFLVSGDGTKVLIQSSLRFISVVGTESEFYYEQGSTYEFRGIRIDTYTLSTPFDASTATRTSYYNLPSVNIGINFNYRVIPIDIVDDFAVFSLYGNHESTIARASDPWTENWLSRLAAYSEDFALKNSVNFRVINDSSQGWRVDAISEVYDGPDPNTKVIDVLIHNNSWGSVMDGCVAFVTVNLTFDAIDTNKIVTAYTGASLRQLYQRPRG